MADIISTKRLPKINWNNVFDILVALGIAGVAGFVLLKSSPLAGMLSYNGLSSHQVRKTYQLFLKRYEVLSMVQGNNFLLGGNFVRGVASGPGGLYYYHFSDDGNGGVEFNVYPELYETWTTNPGILGLGSWFTQRPVYP